MDGLSKFKNFYRDKSIEELQMETTQWKSRIEFQSIELVFLKNLLQANIYKSKNPNLFEILERFKKEIDDITSEGVHILDSVECHIAHLEKEQQYTSSDGNQFYIETHKKLDYDITVFNEEFNVLKMRLFEFIEGTII
jgi:hypothetical protein